ncbi:MAG: glycosyltransferase family 9 protein [Desulfobacterales bacterium]|jgi:ADP-heptose:LPS heptosyltransferase
MAEDKLFILHQGALGDVILTFASIIALRKKFGRIHILCQGQIGKLAVKLGLADKTYPLEAACFATLFSKGVDAKIKDLISSFETIVVFSFSAELENTINQMTDRPCLRIPPRPPAQDNIHVAEFLLQNLIARGLIEAAGANDLVSDWQRQHIRKARRPSDTLKVIIHPGSGSMRKRWPLARFLELADELEERGWQPQFLCGPAESDLDAEIENQNRQVHRFSDLTDLVDWLKTANRYIGNDSGISHLTAFLGIASVIIFGPADPERWQPPGPRVQVVRPALDCDPCLEIEPHNCARSECLTDATLESVLNAFGQLHQNAKH